MSKEEGSCLLTVRVQPRAARTEVKELMSDGSIRVRLKAPPTEGRANTELVALLSRLFKIPASSVKIVAGLTSRQKRVAIRGINATDAAEIIAHTLTSSDKNG